MTVTNPLPGVPPVAVIDARNGTILKQLYDLLRFREIRHEPMCLRFYDPDVSFTPNLLWTFTDTTRLSGITITATITKPTSQSINCRFLICGPSTGQPIITSNTAIKGEPNVIRYGGQEFLNVRLTGNAPSLNLGTFEVIIPAGHGLYFAIDNEYLDYFTWSCNAEPVQVLHDRPNQSPDL